MEEQTQETIIKSTAEGMKRFIEGFIWEDLFNELKIWDNELLKQYDEVTSLEDLKRVQGARESIAYCMQLPYRLAEALADAEEKKEDNSNNETMDKI